MKAKRNKRESRGFEFINEKVESARFSISKKLEYKVLIDRCTPNTSKQYLKCRLTYIFVDVCSSCSFLQFLSLTSK